MKSLVAKRSVRRRSLKEDCRSPFQNIAAKVAALVCNDLNLYVLLDLENSQKMIVWKR